jgi:hypothetical protein
MSDPQSDDDGNGLPAAWEVHHFGTQGQSPETDPNGDGVNLALDFILGGDPHIWNPEYLKIDTDETGQVRLTLNARAAFGPGYSDKTRKFRLLTCNSLDSNGWLPVPDWESIPGDNLTHTFIIPAGSTRGFYRIATWLE